MQPASRRRSGGQSGAALRLLSLVALWQASRTAPVWAGRRTGPQPLAGETGALRQGAELQPRQSSARQSARQRRSQSRSRHPPRHSRALRLHSARCAGPQLRVLDEVGRRVNHARHDVPSGSRPSSKTSIHARGEGWRPRRRPLPAVPLLGSMISRRGMSWLCGPS